VKPLRGLFRVLILHDVAEAIQLDQLRSILALPLPERIPRFAHPTPQYVRFERSPVVEPAAPITLATGERFEVRIKYYDYGVVSVELEMEFECDWKTLVELSSRWIANPGIEGHALELIRDTLKRAMPAMVKPYEDYLTEDYYIIQLHEQGSAEGDPVTAGELLASYGNEIAKIVRGEVVALSEGERKEILQSAISYYPTDLLVVGWTAALICDSPEAAAPTIQLLEYANAQLLEFRHYDNLLTQVLEHVYRSLGRGSGFLGRWRLAREAGRLNRIRLEVTELAERMDNSIKFLSDMFYARLYRLAAAKVGVPDYRNLVDEKLRTAEELYQFMMDQFHQARAFVLELAIVIILIIDLIFLFRGKAQ
jgi:hypothetical protein